MVEILPQVLPPPLPGLIHAASQVDAKHALVPLSVIEQNDCSAAIDYAVAFSGHSSAAKLCESLSKTLALFPCCAGRYVLRDCATEPSQGVAVMQQRVCILCNNAGVGFGFRSVAAKRPSVLGPLPPAVFDRAIGTWSGGKAHTGGGPLLRVRVHDYEDGQLLALSFSQGLSDVQGMCFFLQVWSRLHRGEEPGLPPDCNRLFFEGAQFNGRPRVESEFSPLHRVRLVNPAPASSAVVSAGDRPGVASFLLDWAELKSLSETLSQVCRRRRLIFDSDTLGPEEVAFCLLVGSLHIEVSASIWIDRRIPFGAEHFFGCARGVADVELSEDPHEAVAALRKALKTAENSSDFWAWKAQQMKNKAAESSAELILCDLTQASDLQKFNFGSGAPVGASLGVSFWQRWFADVDARRRAGAGGGVGGNGKGCTSLALLLPHADGVQVQALMPSAAVNRLVAERKQRQNSVSVFQF